MDELWNSVLPDGKTPLGGSFADLSVIEEPEWVAQMDFACYNFYKVTLNPREMKVSPNVYRRYLYSVLNKLPKVVHYSGIEFCKSGKMHLHTLMKVPKSILSEEFNDSVIMNNLRWLFHRISQNIEEGISLRNVTSHPEWLKVYSVPLVIQRIRDNDEKDYRDWVKYVIKQNKASYIREITYKNMPEFKGSKLFR